jgi:hypothetical protein
MLRWVRHPSPACTKPYTRASNHSFKSVQSRSECVRLSPLFCSIASVEACERSPLRKRWVPTELALGWKAGARAAFQNHKRIYAARSSSVNSP